MASKRKNNAFTLIELLVVIAVIGLLASVILISLNSARIKARDARRMADIRQLTTALELYYDANGRYPTSGGASSPNGEWNNSNDSSWAALQTALAVYVSAPPKDPVNQAGWPGSGNYTYIYYTDPNNNYGCGANLWYVLVYKIENGMSQPSPGVVTCGGGQIQYNGGTLNSFSPTGIITVGVGKN